MSALTTGFMFWGVVAPLSSVIAYSILMVIS